MNQKLFVTLLIVLFFCCSCSDNTSNDTVTDYFPNSFGNSWSYSRIDSFFRVDSLLHSVLDTIRVDSVNILVSDSSTIDSLHFLTWTVTTTNFGFWDRGYGYVFKVHTHRDTILCEFSNFGFPERLIFPLELGYRDGSSAVRYPDTTGIAAIDDVTMPDGSVQKAFRVDRHLSRVFSVDDYSFWIVPSVGIVQYSNMYYSGGDWDPKPLWQHQIWRLLNYKVN